jgi:chorismate dehydratase
MKDKIRVVAVNYLNAKPLIKGIIQHPVLNDITLTTAHPAQAAQLLITNQADLGLIPVATMSLMPNVHLIGNFGIAADGRVASVCIFSKVPIENVTHIYLDYQSRTSVKLAQILLKKYFKHTVTYIPAPEDYIQHISGTTAGVIIGDRALELLTHFKYVYDLATIWKEFTGLPFVFAAWVANKALSEKFITAFDEANQLGLQYIDNVVAENPCTYYDLNTYYKKDIVFKLTDDCKKGLFAYLNYLEDMHDELL